MEPETYCWVKDPPPPLNNKDKSVEPEYIVVADIEFTIILSFKLIPTVSPEEIYCIFRLVPADRPLNSAI